MKWRTFFLELLAIVAGAVLCALVANGLAARERKLALVGTYPNALVVPRHMPVASLAPRVLTVPATPVLSSTVAAAVPPPGPGAPGVADPAISSASTASPAPAPLTKGGPKVPPAATRSAVAASRAAPADLLSRFPPHEKTPWVEISGDDVAWLFGQGVPFLDARRTEVYAQGHIAGARSVSVWEADVDDKVKQLLDEGRDQKLPIVVYCSGGDCEDSHMLAQKLWGVFFNNVLVYKDGFPDWQKRGGAIHSGGAP